MNWRVKAAVQNAVARLPASVSYPAYYWMQRRFGGLRRVNPMPRIAAAVDVCERLRAAGRTPAGATFLEIGTGRRVNMPIGFHLAGAERIVTVDLNPYLADDLVRADVEYLAAHAVELETTLGRWGVPERIAALLEFARAQRGRHELLRHCGIAYRAPADAARLDLEPATIDVHMSVYVLEHIPEDGIRAILSEARRVLKPGGVLLHGVDYSDHFAHTDKSISRINFLRFDDASWARLAGNRYMYMNRLRVDDYVRLVEQAGFRVISNEARLELPLVELIRSGGLPLAEQFAARPPETLATTSSWILAEPA